MPDDAPRVPFLDSKADLPADQHHNYERIVESRGQVIGPFGVLLNSPEIAGRTGHLGTYVRFESKLPGDVRELAIVTTAREHDCAFEWATHEPIAREEGVSDAAIEAVETRADLDDLEDREARIVRFGRELLRENEVSDATFQPVAERLGDTGVTELAATFGYYSMLAVVLNALEVNPGEDAPTLS
ncbi:carboxymuconolactone decarboxylase family protein [Halopiger goleimassiliensis]|uniref:carboxymuconolactone decarboxylase family protein n=1 Tax=Halopiger goleimassiliensis TaxID=1293048 RepID=UPI0006781CA6|nr:carboxymuconolactone decarboxylase family protein [Halopiger goleimassiliensis]